MIGVDRRAARISHIEYLKKNKWITITSDQMRIEYLISFIYAHHPEVHPPDA